MAIETKQLHALSKVYNEQIAVGGKKIQAEGVYDTVKTVMDKGSNFVKTNPVGKVLGKVVAPVKGNTGKDLPTAASQKAKGLRTEDAVDEGLMDTLKGVGSFIKNPKATIQKKVDSALTGATKKGKLGNIKVGGSASKLGSIGSGPLKTESYSNWRQDLKEIPDYDQIPVDSKKSNEKITEKKVKNTVKINPDMKEGKRWQDDDGDGKWYEKSDVDGKISKREKKAKNHNCASKVKHEQFGVGDCISEAHDLDENGNVAHYDVEFEEYIVKGVPVEELEILEGHMHEHVIREKEESKIKNCGCGQDPCVTYGKQEDVKEGVYEKKKKEEVMSALKKRDLKDKVKKKIAADIVKKKGDTSKSDDRYAYESKLWDEFAEGYQRNPERDTRSAREKRMDDPDRGINSPAFRAFMAAQEGRSKKSSDKKKKG